MATSFLALENPPVAGERLLRHGLLRLGLLLLRAGELGGHGCAALLELGLPGLGPVLENGQLLLRLADLREALLVGFHQLELAVFQRGDLLLGVLDLVVERGELLVLAGLLLLGFVAGDGALLGLDVEVELLAVGLDLPGAGLQLVEGGGAAGEVGLDLRDLLGLVLQLRRQGGSRACRVPAGRARLHGGVGHRPEPKSGRADGEVFLSLFGLGSLFF